jgi:hypothetical protein
VVTIDNETQKIVSEKEKMENENFGENPEYAFKVFDIERKHSRDKIGNSKNLISRLENMKANSRDINVINKDLRVGLNEDGVLILKTRTGENLQFTRSGFTQFCSKYEVPSNYMKKCIMRDKSKLALKNLNLWIKHSKPEKENLIRIYNERVRGFLSDKYSVMDNSEAVNDLNYAIVNSSDMTYTIERSALNEEKMNLRLVREEQININGEILHVGFRLKNSEVGLHKLELELLLYKQICTNGMIFGGGSGYFYSRKHLGGNNDFRGDFNSLITTIPKAIEYVKNSVEIGMNKQLNSERIQLALDKFCDKFKIEDNEEEREKIYSLAKNYDSNMWGVSNAITEYAQNFSVEDQEEAEKYSARLIFR